MEFISKMAFSFCGINIESFSSINKFGFGFVDKIILSNDWILISGLVIGSIIILSISWFIKGSFSFSNKLIESIDSNIFGVFNISFNSILSKDCNICSGLGFSSINKSFINSYFKGAFSLGGIYNDSDISILFNGFGAFNIVIKQVCCFSFFFGSKGSIKIESTACNNKSSFS